MNHESTLRRIETEKYVYTNEVVFGPSCVESTRTFIKQMNERGVIKSIFNDDIWTCYSGVSNYSINFSFDEISYNTHVGKHFGIPYERMQIMLKCFAAYCMGEYIFSTIADSGIKVIKEFLCRYQDIGYRINIGNVQMVEDFLYFINTPEELTKEVISNIEKVRDDKKNRVRELSPLINYLVIENEINKLFRGPISDEEFVFYFPIYFWVNITFILPLRATEMMVTPFDCLTITDEYIELRVRRTQLKGKNKESTVKYDVDKDYKVFSYRLESVINRSVFENIEKYRSLTQKHERRFLFEYGKGFSNDMFSLPGFNRLLRVFVDEKVIGNTQYEFAKKTCGIDDFEYVTAGDSRPIAMANLYFQGASEDICRQLADHKDIATSEGYFTNVTETLFCSSVIKTQNKINMRRLEGNRSKNEMVYKDRFGCTSIKHRVDPHDISDCKDHYEDCFGCPYYSPEDEEIDKHLKECGSRLEECLKQILADKNRLKGKDAPFDELMLELHTNGAKYKESADIYVQKEAVKWEEHQNTTIIDC